MADNSGHGASTDAGRAPSGDERRALVRFAAVLLHLPNYARLAWDLVHDERLSPGQRATVLAGIGYLALPFDLVPGVIPVAGQIDDLAAIMLALRAVVRSLPPEAAEAHLAAADLSLRTMDRDLEALGATAVWLLSQGARLAAGTVRLAAETVGLIGSTAWQVASALVGSRLPRGKGPAAPRHGPVRPQPQAGAKQPAPRS